MAHDPKALAEALITPDVHSYWEALGRFVSTFSLVEANMQMALWQVVGVREPIAKAIFSGTRVEVAMSHIRRVSEVEQWPTAKANTINDVMAQLDAISK